ncbi:hypothetical protein EDC01DRAFT_779481 [Geopyxis carbonaria]|nr:hypothetical protein EDC01DRAFT_779481 [Geopyxis carbonaria]
MLSFLKVLVLLTIASIGTATPAPAVDKRQSPDWGNYLYIAEQFTGLVGQNVALIAIPSNRAICPYQLVDLQGCANSFQSPCVDERVSFEWCIRNRLPSLSAQWINTTLECTGGERSACITSLGNLHTAASAITVPPLPAR